MYDNHRVPTRAQLGTFITLITVSVTAVGELSRTCHTRVTVRGRLSPKSTVCANSSSHLNDRYVRTPTSKLGDL